MSLTQLRDRLTEIIDGNDAAGWEERNELPVYLRLNRGTRKRDRWYRIRLVSSARMTVGKISMTEFEALERDPANIVWNAKAKSWLTIGQIDGDVEAVILEKEEGSHG
jgi:hypothetical protein